MPKIYLRAGATNPKNVRLRDPAVGDGGGGPVTGIASITFDAMTVAGLGVVAVKGVLSTTFGDMSVAGLGTVAVKGTLATTFDVMTVAGLGRVAVVGTLSTTFDDMTLSGTGLNGAATSTQKFMLFF